MNSQVGSGVCECGCGQKTTQWKQSHSSRGIVKGDYRRYVKGHYQLASKKPFQPAKCHPEREEKAKGLCGSCYNKMLINRTEDSRAKHLSNTSAKAKVRRENTCPQERAVKQRNRVLKHRYGIDSDQYEQMLSAQGGRCAICGAIGGTDKQTRLYVDHNHKTGEVRKLLCPACNTAVGVIESGVERVVALAKYLSETSGNEWNALARLELILRKREVNQ